MINNIKYLLLLSLLSLCIVSCASYKKTNLHIEKVELLGLVNHEIDFSDIAYDERSKTLFVADKQSNKISLYKDFKYQNKFGGSGFNNTQFQRLSDIAIASNGNLLALDDLDKRIKIYNTDGKYLNIIDLKKFSNPVKFSIDRDDFLYIYDNNQQEIIVYNLLNDSEFIRFGKFEIDLPINIVIHGDLLSIRTYDDETDFYTTMGEFVQAVPKLAVQDRYENVITHEGRFLKINGDIYPSIVLPLQVKFIDINGDSLIIASNNQIQLFKLNYRRLGDDK